MTSKIVEHNCVASEINRGEEFRRVEADTWFRRLSRVSVRRLDLSPDLVYGMAENGHVIDVPKETIVVAKYVDATGPKPEPEPEKVAVPQIAERKESFVFNITLAYATHKANRPDCEDLLQSMASAFLNGALTSAKGYGEKFHELASAQRCKTTTGHLAEADFLHDVLCARDKQKRKYGEKIDASHPRGTLAQMAQAYLTGHEGNWPTGIRDVSHSMTANKRERFVNACALLMAQLDTDGSKTKMVMPRRMYEDVCDVLRTHGHHSLTASMAGCITAE